MPQMSPMWWSFLMFLFINLYMIMISINYFSEQKKMMMKKMIKLKMMNWKW